MFKQTVEIEDENILLSWDDNKYRNFSISQNGQVIQMITDIAYLKSGQRVTLPSKKELNIILSDSHGLEVWHKGKECISNSASGDVDYYKQAGNGLIAVGALQCIGLLAVAITPEWGGGQKLIVLAGIAGVAALFIGSGIYGKKTYDKRAYWSGMVLCIGNMLLVLSIFSVIILGFLAYYCYKATQSTPPKHMLVKSDEELPFDQV